MPEGAEPIALAYAGHQFGHFVPQLGDGRAILLGEVVGRDGARRDIQLKGSGPTPFSRGGDGRAALGPVLREYIVSEAMAALGVPTTRALAAVTTGEAVLRETIAARRRPDARRGEPPPRRHLPVLRRAGRHRGGAPAGRPRHRPPLPGSRGGGAPYRALLDAVVARQAELVARWLLVGFIHGVMNTDNTSIAGETIDYGPCAFMDAYDPATVFSSIDHLGRYAYGNQPRIAQWNLARLAEALLPLLADDEEPALAVGARGARGLRPALRGGLPRRPAAQARPRRRARGRRRAGQDLLELMAENGADFTLTFRRLCDAAATGPEGDAAVGRCSRIAGAYDAWAARWRQRSPRSPRTPEARRAAMRAVNPAFIPRNHLVEAALAAAVERQDFGPFEELLEVVARPYEEQPG